MLRIVPHSQLSHLLSSTSFEMITARTVQISSSLVCSVACFWHTASTTWLHHSFAADSLASHSFASDVGSDDLVGSQWPNRTIWDFSWDVCSGPWPLINSCLCPPSQCETQSVRQARSPLVGPAKEKMTPRHFLGMILGQKRHIAFEAATCMLDAFLSYPSFAGIVTSSDGRTKRANHLRID